MWKIQLELSEEDNSIPISGDGDESDYEEIDHPVAVGAEDADIHDEGITDSNDAGNEETEDHTGLLMNASVFTALMESSLMQSMTEDMGPMDLDDDPVFLNEFLPKSRAVTNKPAPEQDPVHVDDLPESQVSLFSQDLPASQTGKNTGFQHTSSPPPLSFMNE